MEFKLPIECIDHKVVSDTIQGDLDMGGCYKKILGSSELLDQWTGYYTTHKPFLHDTQDLLRHAKLTCLDTSDWGTQYTDFHQETNFNDKYQYLNVKCLDPLNYSSLFMQTLSVYNITAPVFSLCTPIFIFIVPFFILRFKNIRISGDEYATLMKEVLKQTSVYKMFYADGSLTYQQKATFGVSILFYIFQIYQNVLSCIQFYTNIHKISTFIDLCKDACLQSIRQIDQIDQQCRPYASYSTFLERNLAQKDILQYLVKKMSFILPYKNTISRFSQIGYIMSFYYSLFYTKEYNEAFEYTRKLNLFVGDMRCFQSMLRKKRLRACTFETGRTHMKSAYYLANINEKPVKNNLVVDKNIIITGPNASGKTTLLKSVLLNLILSQQLGVGCYKRANIHLYEHFHSYLNIPDTSGRDSLFQAEARRCKDILQVIADQSTDRHFCIFDELYSGTNPNDAILCAEIYLKGLFQYKQVEFILTTHYIQLCETFGKNHTHIKNIKMNVVQHPDQIEYTYKIKKGISYVHGGKQILKDLNYPEHLFTL